MNRHPNPGLALALLAGLGAAGGIADPMSEARGALTDLRRARAPRNPCPDRANRRAKNKQARKSRAKNKKR